jgi:hypothetical protein
MRLVVNCRNDDCSTLVILVVAAPLVHAPEPVQSARIGGIGVVDDAVFEHERAHTRPFACVRGDVGSGHGRVLSDGPLVAEHLRLWNGVCRRLAAVVVFNTTLALLFLGERRVEVVIELAAERGRPGERPPPSAACTPAVFLEEPATPPKA